MLEGKLKVQKSPKKGTTSFKVDYINEKGQSKTLSISDPDTIGFDRDLVADGDPVLLEMEGNKLVFCTVPGKKAGFRPEPETVKTSGLWNAVAPYNFIPFNPEAVLPAFEDGRGRWSGKIVCRLKTLSPLLVSGAQTRKTDDSPSECRFVEIGGKKVIPGTSLKGMLRALVEILSFSDMKPVSSKPLFWRRVDNTGYRENFPSEPLGGYLRKIGTDYYLTPATVKKIAWEEDPQKGWVKVWTGGFLKDGKMCTAYAFSEPTGDESAIAIDREVMDNFRTQLTPNQIDRWKPDARKKISKSDAMTLEEKMTSLPGLPVFFRREDKRENGRIIDLGLCRFFRLKYRYTPDELIHPDGAKPPLDFATQLFGSVGEKPGDARKGRVSVCAAFIEGKPAREVKVILGGPKPTCVPMYLEQNPAKLERLKEAKFPQNDPGAFKNYNEKARLRGRKLYWHHAIDIPALPGDKGGKVNNKVLSMLYPVDRDATAEVVIHVDRLTDRELGCLLEAIDLPKDHAHKLGMGKSLGFGSVRLDIDWDKTDIRDVRQLRQSLEDRLAGRTAKALGKDQAGELREGFRDAVVRAQCAIYGADPEKADYDSLPGIRDLRIMMNFKNCPDAEAVRVMQLNDDGSGVNFRSKAVLPTPLQVVKNQGK